MFEMSLITDQEEAWRIFVTVKLTFTKQCSMPVTLGGILFECGDSTTWIEGLGCNDLDVA